MKTVLLLFLFFILPSQGAVDDWLHDPDKGWEQAKKENKLLFILHTKPIDSEEVPLALPRNFYARERRLFSSPEFAALEEKYIVPVSLILGECRLSEYKLFKDYPDILKQSTKARLIDANGELVWAFILKEYIMDERTDTFRYLNETHMPEFLNELKAGIVTGRIISSNLKEIPTAEGTKKLKLLVQTYNLMMKTFLLPNTSYYYGKLNFNSNGMSEPLKKKTFEMAKEIARLDRQDVYGFRKKINDYETSEKQKMNFINFVDKTVVPLMNKRQYQKTLEECHKYIETQNPPKIIKAIIHRNIISYIYYLTENFDLYIKYTREALSLDPKVENSPYFNSKFFKEISSSNPKDREKALMEYRQLKQMAKLVKPGNVRPDYFLPGNWAYYLDRKKAQEALEKPR